MKSFFEGCGRVILFSLSDFLLLVPRLAFDAVCPWDPNHPVLWQIPATTLMVLFSVGTIAAMYFFLLKDDY